MEDKFQDLRSLALTPTWSVATVLTIFVAVSLLVERSIHRLSSWLKKTHRNPLFEALEKMKEELMLLGFISLLLTACSRTISNICIDSKYYNGKFTPCKQSDVEDTAEDHETSLQPDHRRLMGSILSHYLRRVLYDPNHNSCKEGHEPFVSYEGMEQLHRFIFVMAITHLSYSCFTMLLTIVKIHTWRKWEDESHRNQYDSLADISRALTMGRQTPLVDFHTSNPWTRNRSLVWVTCFFRQFGTSVVRADYLTLRVAFLKNHNLPSRYDFHRYMVRSMEDEFKIIVGVSAPLWGFVVTFMLFDINGSDLYFWIAIIPIVLVLLVGAKLQQIIATLTLESAGINGFFTGCKLKPRDELFWFKKPELLLSLIHFILFQNAFELASFFWFWWQFGYNSCFLSKHRLVYARLILGFAGQFLCSYSTLPLYALVTQMGSNYKAALIPHDIQDSIRGWRDDARRKARHRRGLSVDGSTTIHTETSTICLIEEDEQLLGDETNHPYTQSQIELQPNSTDENTTIHTIVSENSHFSSTTPLLHSSSFPLTAPEMATQSKILRSVSVPTWRG